MPVARRPRAPRLASGGAIREAAAALFLERGYQGTSMDDVAARAGVSKQTIYTHFANKEELFEDLVLGNVGRVEEFAAALRAAFESAHDAASGLRAVARLYVRFVIRPEVLRLRRLILGEAARFPELARRYYAGVLERTYATLAELLGELAKEGLLRTDDPLLAAHHFAWLALGLPLDQAMFEPDRLPSPAELDKLADAAVEVFLAAYSQPKGG
ncbi:MAG TPA: TetR/AcrR family transcriptional regulator [Candidatus Dormibacteraeota bacterium]